ncbi:MAG: polysaccharide deacetylase family protein [Planctomycetes bacterium]|nr:polysaccharide deacetylase family protein [Planctomycetota bacterium]
MPIRHALKRALRGLYARALFHTGAHALVDRIMPRRLLVLAGHCVAEAGNAPLGPNMRIGAAELERILAWFARRYEVLELRRALERLAEPGKRSLVALTMDDGYRDNLTQLLPLLQRLKLSATIYLESAPLDERRLNWTHKYFWLQERIGLERLTALYLERAADSRTKELLRPGLSAYHHKRILKYEAPAPERTRIIDELFRLEGGDERALCDQLYLTWQDVRELDRAGVEIGAHTVHHEILARLEPAAAAREVGDSKDALERTLGRPVTSFAYPFGRRWDYHAAAKQSARDSGFTSATTTHAGTNNPSTDRYELKRVMIDEHTQLHLLVAEACGGFDLLRGFGLDLAE